MNLSAVDVMIVRCRGSRCSATLLAVEIAADADKVRADLLQRLGWARIAQIVIVPRIPVDRRHNAKVEYPALMRLLDSELRK